MPDFERLRRPGTRADARRSTALLVAEAHETVYQLVSREGNGYVDRSFLLHTPEQVRNGAWVGSLSLARITEMNP